MRRNSHGILISEHPENGFPNLTEYTVYFLPLQVPAGEGDLLHHQEGPLSGQLHRPRLHRGHQEGEEVHLRGEPVLHGLRLRLARRPSIVSHIFFKKNMLTNLNFNRMSTATTWCPWRSPRRSARASSVGGGEEGGKF